MRRARTSAGLGRFAKRAIVCLLLGAVLQYLVAAGFGLSASYGGLWQKWTLEITEPVKSVRLDIVMWPSIGRDVLVDVITADDPNSVRQPLDSKPDWSRGTWQEVIVPDNRTNEPHLEKPSRPPPAWSRFASIRTNPAFDYYPPSLQGLCFEVGCGWPMRSASYLGIMPKVPGGPYTFREGIVIVNSEFTDYTTPRAIPLDLIWPGTMVNTALYAAVLLVPMYLVLGVRRRLRRRRGQCVECKYDLRGAEHAVCPECGAAIAP